MAATQYNFKIDEELKNEIEIAMQATGAESKADFLADMFSAWQRQKARGITIDDEELAKYEGLSNTTKKAIKDAFILISRQLDGELATFIAAQQKVKAEADELSKEREEMLNEIAKIKAKSAEEIQALKSKYTEEIEELKKAKSDAERKLESDKALNEQKQKQIESLKAIEGQIEIVMADNKALRLEREELEKKLFETKKSAQMGLKEIETKTTQEINSLREKLVESDKKIAILSTEKDVALQRIKEIEIYISQAQKAKMEAAKLSGIIEALKSQIEQDNKKNETEE